VLVLADAGPPLGLARLGVGELLVLLDQGEGHGQRNIAHTVERGQEVNPFDARARGVVVVPADEFTGVGVRLVGDAVVDDQGRVLVLHPPDERLDDLPEVGRGQGLCREEARDLVMADVRLQQPRQARGGRRAERGDQVVRIQIQEWLV